MSKNRLTREQIRARGPKLSRALVRRLNNLCLAESWPNSPHQVVCAVALERGCKYYEVKRVTRADIDRALLALRGIPREQFNLGVTF